MRTQPDLSFLSIVSHAFSADPPDSYLAMMFMYQDQLSVSCEVCFNASVTAVPSTSLPHGLPPIVWPISSIFPSANTACSPVIR